MTASQQFRKTYPISWDQLHRDSKALSWRLLDHDYFKGIVAVTRGGGSFPPPSSPANSTSGWSTRSASSATTGRTSAAILKFSNRSTTTAMVG